MGEVTSSSGNVFADIGCEGLEGTQRLARECVKKAREIVDKYPALDDTLMHGTLVADIGQALFSASTRNQEVAALRSELKEAVEIIEGFVEHSFPDYTVRDSEEEYSKVYPKAKAFLSRHQETSNG